MENFPLGFSKHRRLSGLGVGEWGEKRFCDLGKGEV